MKLYEIFYFKIIYLGTHYHTLTDREVRLSNRVLTIQYDSSKCQSVYLLFEETFYTADLIKYCIWYVKTIITNIIFFKCYEKDLSILFEYLDEGLKCIRNTKTDCFKYYFFNKSLSVE
jgi:hypothetical protein